MRIISLPSTMPEPLNLSDLDLPSATLSALQSSNLTTIAQILSQTTQQLQRTSSLSTTTLQKIYQTIYSRTASRAVPLSKLSSLPASLPTRSASLTNALNGGWPAASIVQLAGATQTCKTQTALSAAASALQISQGVIWLDTSSHHATHARLTHILSSRGLNDSEVQHALSFLLLIPAPTPQQAITILRDLQSDQATLSVVQTNSIPELVIRSPRIIALDSAASLLGPVLGLRSEGWSGHVLLNEMAVLLRSLSVRTAATVLVTNRVVKGVDGRPALGNAWACFPDVCLLLERRVLREEGTACVEALVTSKRSATKHCIFSIDRCGVCDDVT